MLLGIDPSGADAINFDEIGMNKLLRMSFSYDSWNSVFRRRSFEWK